MQRFIFDGENLPEGAGAVNRGDRRTVVKTHFGKVSLDPGQGLIAVSSTGFKKIQRGDQIIPLVGGGYRVLRPILIEETDVVSTDRIQVV